MPTERNDEEEAYFKALEIEQRRKLREKLETAAKDLADKQAIADSVKTEDLSVAERIKALGFSGESSKVFDLLPLVHVAWADGSIQKGERAAILRVLEARGVAPGSEGFTLMESLLEERPSDEYMQQSLAVLRELVGNDGRSAEIVDLCQTVASAAGGFLGLGAKVDDKERALIEEIAQQLRGGSDELRKSF
ncbi:TerB family tellurite resistance protein [Paraliomyxa miuraensis]|uniref:TerB family tellurite resistance protein n=1 Tax=Paraliomyxa miuraensis TaxID=376150 RepID=UPI0022500B05|nr:TerB family tellurite resistance protein [Paraliomyxa miuraensis]MCX4247946.1 TerB family tellurite resistance protein [Paraliomyxa miuraensis]